MTDRPDPAKGEGLGRPRRLAPRAPLPRKSPAAGQEPPAAPQRFRQPETQRICGTAAVRALFLRRPEQVLRLFFTPEQAGFAAPLTRYLARRRAPFREVPAEELTRIAGTPHHGGIVAVTAARYAEPLPDRLPSVLWSAPVLPVLDGVGNPHNLGAILRSAVFLGCRACLISAEPRQADLSDAVFRTARGAAEHIALFRSHDLPAVLSRLSARMTTVVALAHGGAPPERLPRGRPIALVVGHEEEGPREAVIAACRHRVTLPAKGPVESLNVAVAAALLMYALSSPA
ncbi:MAG: RNA methyltransferase [Rhodovarius sp.]|nr:RNA methyltransferase [Rhodovarius sp.]